MLQRILKCSNLKSDLQNALHSLDYDTLFILTDNHTSQLCLPLLLETGVIEGAKCITIKAGDANKNIETLSTVWEYLSEHGATRKSVMINLGGGMLTDLGGFAAATFKRGIRFINIPTTLLGSVDAAVGGKTGVNFHGLKNEIGVFTPAEVVLIDTAFLKTLNREDFLSGYAEMLKHSLLHSEEEWAKILSFDVDSINYETLKDLLAISVGIKEKIVKEDPTEKGIRKALNLGHTIGHALESLSFEVNTPIAHGYAVAWGLICELYLSYRQLKFDQNKLLKTANFIKENYGAFFFDCRQYQRLYELMQHDKKNDSAEINFTFLKAVGQVEINQTASKNEIFESFDFYREFLGC